MNAKVIRVLLIEDNPADARLVEEYLSEAPNSSYTLTHVRQLSEALGTPLLEQADVVMLDLTLPDSMGLDTFRAFQREAPGLPVVVFSGLDDRKVAFQAVREGAQDYLVKGQVTPDLQARALHYALVRHRLQRESMRYQADLRASEARFRTMIEQSADAVLIVDRQGTVRFANPSAEVLFGRRIADLQEHPIGFPMIVGVPSELDIAHPKRGDVVAEMRASEIDWEGERANLVLLRDVTVRRRVQVEREGLITELEAKNEALERFTYTVSHDLKSPLVTIGGYAGLLTHHVQAGDVSACESDTAQIQKAVVQMEHLLDDLLHLSRVGHQVHPPEAVSLTEVASEAAGLVAGQLAKHGVQVEIADDLPVVLGDRLRLREVFQNLLDNAAKYSGEQPVPRVEVGVREKGGETVVYVRDNGRGIDARYQERIFNLFERLDADNPGTGVGLALVRQIIEEHRGRVWVESDGEGHGSTFCFTVPSLPREGA